jgi:PAS domain S-box-containing protein
MTDIKMSQNAGRPLRKSLRFDFALLTRPAGRYGLALCAVAVFALLRWLMPDVLSRAPYLGFYPAVVVAAILGGVGPGLVATFASLLLVNFVFVQFNLLDYGLQMRNVIWILGSSGVSFLAGKLKRAHERLLQFNSQLEQRIAERNRAEEVVRKSQETFVELVERAPFGVYIVDAHFHIAMMNTGSQEGAFRNVQPVIGRDFGEAMRILWPEGVAAQIIGLFRHTLETGESYYSPRFVSPRADVEITESYEWELHRMAFPDGDYGVICYYYDSTKVRQAEAALRESEELFRHFFDNAPLGKTLTTPQGVLERANPALCQMLGYSAEELARMTFLDITHPDDARISKECTRAMLAGERDTYDLQKRYVAKDGRIVWTHVVTTLLRDSQGQPLRFLTHILDITERKQAEEELKKSVREKEVLLKEIHHRVKNNMQVISSLVDLQTDQLQDASMRAVLKDVTHRVRSMALVHETLYQSSDMAQIDFAEYARSLLVYLWRAYGNVASGIRLTLDLEPIHLSVNSAVPSGLILNELATNALKHAFRGRSSGEVIVSLHCGPEGRACLRVRDDGKGLPAELDWRQAKSLGLSLVQILAKQLSASVEVHCDAGTEFSISFGV